jgi:hypothetical protein
MDVTWLTWTVALTGLALIVLLCALELVAVVRPRAEWTVANVYGGTPEGTDPAAYFAFNQGYAWADTVFWGPLQVAGSVGMILGHRWGFLVALMASVPFWYSAVPIFIWDRDMGFRENSATYWIVVWGMWPVFGVAEGLYCLVRLLD